MYFDLIRWDARDDPNGNVEHIADNGVRPEEVEYVLQMAYESDVGRSRSSGLPAVIGDTARGRSLFVVFRRSKVDGLVIIDPATAIDHEG